MEELNNFLTNAPFMVNILNPVVTNILKVTEFNKINQKDNIGKTCKTYDEDLVISCILWSDNDNNCNFFMTGIDIIKILVYKFEIIGRPIKNMKKFEDGVYSDLRYTPGVLENPRSDFLIFLYKNSCLRTLKKQKVFFWEYIDHNNLFLKALSRDLLREAKGLPTISIPTLNYCPNRIFEIHKKKLLIEN